MKKFAALFCVFALFMGMVSCSPGVPVQDESSSSTGSYATEDNSLQHAETPAYNSSVSFSSEEVTGSGQSSSVGDASSATPPIAQEQKVAGVWLSYLDLTTLLKGKSEREAEAALGQAFDQIQQMGLNSVFVQVRPFSDALYQSELFPWSHILTGEQGKDPGYDPLEIMVELAHDRGLAIHAWINPYRVRTDSSLELSQDNPAVQHSEYLLEHEDGLYYDPSNPKVRELIVQGVQEILDHYEVDGIHFDDYFYPSGIGEEFDADSYKASGTTLSLGDWRRENVDTLVRTVYTAVKSADETISFGISPAGNLENCYEYSYANVQKWMQHNGYIDYICPQIYWGFEHSTADYQSVLEKWSDLTTASNVKLYVGLGAYRIGVGDGDSVEEWTTSGDVLMRQVEQARKEPKYGGFILYRYENLFDGSPIHQQEKENLQSIL